MRLDTIDSKCDRIISSAASIFSAVMQRLAPAAEDEHTDDSVIRNMASSRQTVQSRTTPAEVFSVLNCPVTSIGELDTLEEQMDKSRSHRSCLRHALQKSVSTADTHSNNMKIARIIMSKVASDELWCSLSVSGRSGTSKISLEHKYPILFQIIHKTIGEKTSVLGPDVKSTMSKVLRGNTTKLQNRSRTATPRARDQAQPSTSGTSHIRDPVTARHSSAADSGEDTESTEPLDSDSD